MSMLQVCDLSILLMGGHRRGGQDTRLIKAQNAAPPPSPPSPRTESFFWPHATLYSNGLEDNKQMQLRAVGLCVRPPSRVRGRWPLTETPLL